MYAIRVPIGEYSSILQKVYLEMTTNQPNVSVIIPAFNCEQFVGQAIDSVLAQTSPPSQLIVVDDGSTDGTSGVVRSFGAKIDYLYQQNAGIGAAVNFGLARAQGDVLAFLDADDLWMPEKLMRQLTEMLQHPDLDMIFAHMEQFHNGFNAEQVSDHESRKIIPGYCKGTMVIKKSSFLSVGSFESKRVLGDFIDWYARASEIGLKSMLLPDVLLRRRIHGGNTVIREHNSSADYVRILKESLDRRRKKTVQ